MISSLFVAILFLHFNGLEMLLNLTKHTSGTTNYTSSAILSKNSSSETEGIRDGSENITDKCPKYDDVIQEICYFIFPDNCSVFNPSRTTFSKLNSELIFQNFSFYIDINILHSFCTKRLLTDSKTEYSNITHNNEDKNDSTSAISTGYPNFTFVRYDRIQNTTDIRFTTENYSINFSNECYRLSLEPNRTVTTLLENVDNCTFRFLYCLNSFYIEFNTTNLDNTSVDMTFIRNCYSNCESFDSTFHCESCKSGWYGDYCQHMCSKYCDGNVCDKHIGTCKPCLNGWFGNKCDQHCLSNCAKCLDNYTCIDCTDGFFGRYCEYKCPENCKTCSRDGKTCETCSSDRYYGKVCQCRTSECAYYSPSLYCLECKLPGWYVSWVGCCPCSDHCVDGQGSCDNTTGACLDGCMTGYYGRNCDDTCSEHCTGNDTVCDSMTGECRNGCEKGWALSTCTYECSLYYPYCSKCANLFGEMKCSECIQGYYMPQQYRLTNETLSYLNDSQTSYFSDYCVPCDHCLDNNCDGNSGLCSDRCKIHGRYNAIETASGQPFCALECNTCAFKNCNSTDGTCVDGCVEGYYGEKCEVTCSTTCYNQTCKQSSGECHTCEFGYYGFTCNQTCGHCSNVICDKITGDCKGSCKQGYYGEKCDQACINCVGNVCAFDGKCSYGCIPGKYGEYCNKRCPNKCFSCHPMHGTCIIHDISEFGTRLSGLNISTTGICQHGRYGIECNRLCGVGCKRQTGLWPQCDKYTGYCSVCIKGYHGYKCDDRCNETCIDGDCNKNGTCVIGCIDRWQGIYCQKHFPITIFEQYSAILFGVLCFGTFTITLIFVVLSIRNEQKKKYLKQKVADRYHHAVQHVHEKVTFV